VLDRGAKAVRDVIQEQPGAARVRFIIQRSDKTTSVVKNEPDPSSPSSENVSDPFDSLDDLRQIRKYNLALGLVRNGCHPMP
jgi:hypothetical protein